MTKKTEWACEICGKTFKSRSARLYHLRHPGDAHKGKEDPPKAPGSAVTPPDQKAHSVSIQENKKLFETQMNVTVPDPEITEYPPAKDDEPISTFWLWPAVLVVLLVAGALIFRDRLREFFSGKPPKGGSTIASG